MKIQFNSRKNLLAVGLQASAAAIMLAAPLISSADQIMRKDGHEITCKVVGDDALRLSLFLWEDFNLTIMHGSHLEYQCFGQYKTETYYLKNKRYERKNYSGYYTCNRQSGSLGIWDYPNKYEVYLSKGHPEAEKHICMDFMDKHLKLATQ